ncbi:hypothetical protein OKW33_005961 [Paraburkholderia atlantica]
MFHRLLVARRQRYRLSSLRCRVDPHRRVRRRTDAAVCDRYAHHYDAPGFDPSVIEDDFIEEGQRIATDAKSRLATYGVKGSPMPS